MNGLFIGPYRQNDGWGMASRDYIKAIATQFTNLTTRPIYLIDRVTQELDEDLLKYEKTFCKNYDVVFQKSLPHLISSNNRKIKKNVAMFTLETNDLSRSSCVNILNNVDEICVPSTQEKKCLKISGVTTPIKVVSQPIDVDFYLNNRNHKIELPKWTDRTFKFYTIGEWSDRKNLLDLVTAFHLTFEPWENVSLIIKTSGPAKSPAESMQQVQKEINTLKQQLNIRKIYQQELIICDRLSDKDLVGLHNASDCFVVSSCGEAFCRPAAEALILGKTPIVTDNTGMTDFINSKNGFIVNSRKVPVILKQRPLSNEFDIYNAYEYWYKPSIYSLMDNMRKVYTMYKKERKTYNEKQNIGMNESDQFRYETIGKRICDNL